MAEIEIEELARLSSAEVCPNCTVLYIPDPDEGGVCPVCATRRETLKLYGALQTALEMKRDKRHNRPRIIHPGRK